MDDLYNELEGKKLDLSEMNLIIAHQEKLVEKEEMLMAKLDNESSEDTKRNQYSNLKKNAFGTEKLPTINKGQEGAASWLFNAGSIEDQKK
jgi:hypothetical protein